MSNKEFLKAYYFHEKNWESWEQLCKAFKWEIPERFNIANFVCSRWANNKSKIAIFYENASGERGKITFWELERESNKLANLLESLGVVKGDRVGVILPQRPETAIAHIACWKMGAVSVPLSTLFGPEAIQYRLNDCGAKVCIVDEGVLNTFRKVKNNLHTLKYSIVVGDVNLEERELKFWDALHSVKSEYKSVDTNAEDDAIIIYTSGTTGDPKGAVHAHRVLLGHLPMFLTAWCNLEIHESDLIWTPAEWAWIAALFDVLFPALFYGMPVLAYRGGKFDPMKAFELIERYGVTIFFAPPTALRIMMQIDKPQRFNLDSVRVIVSGGESLGSSIPRWAKDVFPNSVVHEAYGQTEANLLLGDCTKLFEFRGDWIGKPGVGHIVEIIDSETGKVLEPGEVGEIAVKTSGNPVIFKEYWNKPEKTAEKFLGEWLLTEDLGVKDAEGYIQFKGRKDDVIKCSGYRIGPEEIEKVLASHEAVALAAVIGIPDSMRGQVPKAFVVLTKDYKPSEELKKELQTYVRERVAKYAYPREIEFVDELPMTPSGKIKRFELKRLEKSMGR